MQKVLLALLAIFLPPVAVGLSEGLTAHFWINIVLVLFFFVPAVIHALYVVFKNDFAMATA